MSQLLSRSVLTAVAAAALCFACGADQKAANSANDPSSESPAETSTPQPGDAATPAPTGEPTAPPPQSLNPATPGNTVAMPKAAAQPATVQLSDSQIAMLTDLANSSEIDQAKVAQGKAKSASVKKFAAMMIKHHSDAKAEQAKLVKQLNLTPTQSQNATSLKQDADKTLSSLRVATGAAFDERYMDSQVEAHQKLLDALNNELLPAATDQELRNGLTKMKATVESHLEQAKSIQAELAKTSTAH